MRKTHIKARVVRFGPPADSMGMVFAEGCIKSDVVGVPVTVNFDASKVVGEATVHTDGSADVTLLGEHNLGVDPDISIGFRCVAHSHEAQDFVVNELAPICLGVLPKPKA